MGRVSRQQTFNPLDYLLGKGMLRTMKCNDADSRHEWYSLKGPQEFSVILIRPLHELKMLQVVEAVRFSPLLPSACF